MLYISKNKNKNYNVKILNDIENIIKFLENKKFSLKNYKYILDIYMIHKDENFYKIKKLSDIKNYAIIRDDNGNRSVILKNNQEQSAKIHSIFFTHDLLYNFGYYELFHLNKDIYEYECKYDNGLIIKFKILDIKDQGCYINIKNINLMEFKLIIKTLRNIGFKFDLKNCEVDYLQFKLDKVIFKK